MNKRFLTFLLIITSTLVGFTNAGLKDIETAIIKKDYPLAQKLAKDLLTHNNLDEKTSQEANYYLGLSHVHLQQYVQAREIFESLIKKNNAQKLRDKAYLGLYDTQYLSGQYKQSLKTIKKLSKLNPNSEFTSLIYLKLARANLKLARWADARKLLNKIVDDYPESLEFYTAHQLLAEKQYFAVQVGAFMEQSRAAKLAEELLNKNEYAYIVETKDQHDRKFYRVRVGQLSLLGDARKLKTKLSSQGYPTQIYP